MAWCKKAFNLDISDFEFVAIFYLISESSNTFISAKNIKLSLKFFDKFFVSSCMIPT